MWAWHGWVCSLRLVSETVCRKNVCHKPGAEFMLNHVEPNAFNCCIRLVLVSRGNDYNKKTQLVRHPGWNLESARRWGAKSWDLGMWSRVVIAVFCSLFVVKRGPKIFGRNQWPSEMATERGLCVDIGVIDSWFIIMNRNHIFYILVNSNVLERVVDALASIRPSFFCRRPRHISQFSGVTASFSEFPWNQVGPLCSTIACRPEISCIQSNQWSPFIWCSHDEYFLKFVSWLLYSIIQYMSLFAGILVLKLNFVGICCSLEWHMLPGAIPARK